MTMAVPSDSRGRIGGTSGPGSRAGRASAHRGPQPTHCVAWPRTRRTAHPAAEVRTATRPAAAPVRPRQPSTERSGQKADASGEVERDSSKVAEHLVGFRQQQPPGTVGARVDENRTEPVRVDTVHRRHGRCQLAPNCMSQSAFSDEREFVAIPLSVHLCRIRGTGREPVPARTTCPCGHASHVREAGCA